MSVSEPGKIITPWAESGLKNAIPAAANPATGRAGFDQGFSAINMTAKEAGGIPPFGQDFNGIFYEVTNILRYMQAGGKPTYDAAFAAAIGGYPSGAVLIGDDGVSVFQNAVAGNETDPNSGGAGWTRPDLQVMELYRRSYAEAGYNVVGTFQAGFTYVNANDVGIDLTTGKGYTGPAGPVAAGTDPASSGFVDRSGSVFSVATVNTLGEGIYGVGAKVTILDRAYAIFEVVSGGVPDGYILLDAGNGNTAVYVNSGIINVEHFGAVADCWLDAAHTQPNPNPTDNTVPFEKALSLQGTLEIPFRPNGYMYSSRLNFSDRVVHGNGATLVPHNFSEEYSVTFHNVKINDLKFKPRDWGVNSFNGRPYLVTFTSVLDRCDFTAYQKSQLFFDDINASPKVQPYYTEHRECRFRYFKEHNIVIKQGANLIKFFGGITGWAGAPAYMQPPTVEGLYDGLITARDSSPTPIGLYTPESLVILGMDGSYNSRYGFNFDKLSFANISTGYTEYNLKKSMRLGDIVGSSILANKISDGYDNNIPLIDWNNTGGVGRYHNRIVINGQSIGSGSSTGAGLRALNFELAYSQAVLVKQGCYPTLTGTQAGYVQLTSMFPQVYSEFQLDENFNLKSTRKGHDIQTRTHEFSSALPAPDGYGKTFAWLRSTGELFFCNPVSGWKKVSLV